MRRMVFSNNMSNKRLSLYDTVELLCIIPLFLDVAYPGIRALVNLSVFSLACVLVWCVCAYLHSPKTMSTILGKTWYFIPYMLYVVLFPYITGNPSIGNRYLEQSMLIFAVYIFLYYSMRNEWRIFNMATKIALPLFLFSIVQTFMAGLSNAWIIRQIDRPEQYGKYMLAGIGGYHFIYALSGISVLCLLLGQNEQRSKRGIILYIISLFSFLTVLISNFVTAILMCLIGYVLLFCVKLWKTNRRKMLVTTILIILCLIFFDSFFSNILLGRLDQDGRLYAVLVQEESMTLAISKEFIRDRWPMMKISIDSFWQHPIFGVVAHTINQQNGFDIGYGHHSFMLDTFALYGMVIGVATIVIVCWPYKHFEIYKKYKHFSIVFFSVFLMMALLNNLTISTITFFVIICPYLLTTRLQNGIKGVGLGQIGMYK